LKYRQKRHDELNVKKVQTKSKRKRASEERRQGERSKPDRRGSQKCARTLEKARRSTVNLVSKIARVALRAPKVG
jgi:hypothetical protein